MILNSTRARPLLMTLLALCLSASLARAEVRVAKIFSDHMVLQRDRPAPVWGWAAPGQAVTVAFAGQTKRATADAQGRWRVTLDPLPANSTGRELTVKAEGATPQRVTIQDVLVGEVWFTVGQSNMMMGLAGATGGADGLKRLEACTHLRVANIPGQQSQAPEPQLDLTQPVSWTRPPINGGYSAVSGFFAEKLYRHLGGEVPVGMITAVAIVPAEAWVDAPSLTDSPALEHLLKSPLNMTSKWFNGIIAPLGPYALRGVLYYQGEYNGGRGAEFQVLFPALIQSWRTSLEQPNLPFLFVQLPGFIEHRAEQDRQLDMDAATLAALHQPKLSGVWTDLREAQWNVWRSVPHTGMAVTIDVGEPYDIHPKQKEPVAERLLLSARQVAYGEDVVGSSPVPTRVEVDGDRFRVTFEHVGAGLVAKGGTLDGFDIAGEDLVLRPAQARIEGGRQVVVWHPEVKRPSLLHDAWGSFPRCSLYNSSGLPATPFRHKVRDRIHPVDAARFAFRNRSFEEGPPDKPETAADWVLANGAVRTRERASDGEWSLKLPAKEAGASQNDIARGFGCVWNCDPLLPLAVRPGCVAAYSVDMAVTITNGQRRTGPHQLNYGASLPKASHNANIYLLQDDVPNFLRFWMNSYAIMVGSDGKMWEWGDWGGYGECLHPDNGTAGWFLENFRNLLVMEEGSSLWIARGTPRSWLEAGKRISVQNAPTYFGTVAYEIVSDVDNGKITATIEVPSRKAPAAVQLRFRHPKSALIKGVTVNGKEWKAFDKDKETIELKGLTGTVNVTANY